MGRTVVFSILILGVLYGAPNAAAWSTESTKDTLEYVSQADTAYVPAEGEMLDPDTTGRVKKIRIVRREFSYRRQIVSSLAVMFFFFGIIQGTVQNWNP